MQLQILIIAYSYYLDRIGGDKIGLITLDNDQFHSNWIWCNLLYEKKDGE